MSHHNSKAQRSRPHHNATRQPLTRLPKVLVPIYAYPPAVRAGGPPVSVSRVLREIAAGNIAAPTVLTSAREIRNGPPLDVEKNSWTNYADHQVFYGTCITRPFWRALRTKPAPRLLYLNSFFSFRYTFIPLLLTKLLPARRRPSLVIAPRGEFYESALKKSAWKKRLYSIATSRRALRLVEMATWEAADTKEADSIKSYVTRKHLASDPVTQIVPPLGPSPRRTVAASTEPISLDRPLSLIQVGRLVPHKNCLATIESLKTVHRPIILTFVGAPEDPAYHKALMSASVRVPDRHTVCFLGPQPNEAVAELLFLNDAMIHPSYGESFGQAIAEAASQGIPIITNQHNPWFHRLGLPAELNCGTHRTTLAQAVTALGHTSGMELLLLKQRILEAYTEYELRQAATVKDAWMRRVHGHATN